MPLESTPTQSAGGIAVGQYILAQHHKGLVGNHTYSEGALTWQIALETHFGTYDTVVYPEVVRIAFEHDLWVSAFLGPYDGRGEWQPGGAVTFPPQTYIGVVLRLHPGG